MDYATLIATIRTNVRELPFESPIRGAVVIRRLGADLPQSEALPELSQDERVIEAVRRTISHPHEVHPMPDRWEDRQHVVFYRHVTEGRRRWDFEVEVAVDEGQHAVIADARVTRPEERLPDDDWATPPPAMPLPVGLAACPCCGHATLTQRGRGEICPVCLWEDDGQDSEDMDRHRTDGPNLVALREARVNFLRFGASVEEDCESVRRPTLEEVRLRRFDEDGDELAPE